MKKTWTETHARETIKAFLDGERIVNFKGKGTLRQCSAADYLANKHGYIISNEAPQGGKVK